MSQGCNHLIAQGAFMAESPEKMLEEILERNLLLKNRMSSSSSLQLTGSSSQKGDPNQTGSPTQSGSLSQVSSLTQSNSLCLLGRSDTFDSSSSLASLDLSGSTFGNYSGNLSESIGKLSCSDKAQSILKLLDFNDPVSMNDLLEQADFSFSELNHELTQLELQGFIYQPQPQLFLKKLN